MNSEIAENTVMAEENAEQKQYMAEVIDNASTIIAAEKSTHDYPIFQFDYTKVTKHPNADRLGLFKIPDSDYNYVLNLSDWENYCGLVCWIPPDTLVPTAQHEFDFLLSEGKYQSDSSKGGFYARIKAKKLRGIVSYGLLVKINNADDVSDLDLHHYEPQINIGAKGIYSGGEVASPPIGTYPKYDVDAALKYANKVFTADEPVWIFEKIHGCNSRFIYQNNQMFCGSRTEWKKEFASPPNLTLEELIIKIGDEEKAKNIYEKAVVNFTPKRNLWWIALENTPSLKDYCLNHENYCVYGEVFGQVQSLKYGAKEGQLWFAAFDILQPNGQWMNMPEFYETCVKFNIPVCPLISKEFPFNLNNLQELVNRKSMWPTANHYAEGIVISPPKERWDERLGRVKLKLINPEYLEKS